MKSLLTILHAKPISTRQIPGIRSGRCYSDAPTCRLALQELLSEALDCTGASVGYVMLLSAQQGHLETELALTRDVPFAFPRIRRLSEAIEGQVAASGSPLCLRAEAKERGMEEAESWTEALCVPLVEAAAPPRESCVMGTLTLIHAKKAMRFQEKNRESAGLIAAMMTTAILNQRAITGQRQALMDSLCRLIGNLEAKSPLTNRHSIRVAHLCALIARSLRLPEEVSTELYQGATLHEIGMLGIPEALQNKPERLTEEEFEQLQQHTKIGYEICKPLGFSEMMLMLIRNHHERLDGTGYPDGLRSSQLPLSLRIICVADAFDAMSSYRPYRERMSAEGITEQLNRFSGSQFDPVVVETLKDLMVKGELNDLYAVGPPSADQL